MSIVCQLCFHKQIGRNVHAYVDYIAVKSQKKEAMLADLKETFDNLRVYQMKLNLTKCVFDVPAGKLLGFLVSKQGIELISIRIRLSQCSPSRPTSTTSRE